MARLGQTPAWAWLVIFLLALILIATWGVVAALRDIYGLILELTEDELKMKRLRNSHF